jgi:transcriptional regulator with XRE-family HTH domain
MGLDERLAHRLRTLRRARGLTLEQLAARSGVSRSMISLIERQETSPTATVLDKLAGALEVTLSALFDTPADAPLARAAQQPVWRDPASGYRRRQVSPGDAGSPVDLVEVIFPAGETVVFESAGPAVPPQLVWMLAGEMVLTLGPQSWRLAAGDCLALPASPRIAFHNPGCEPARYALARAVAACSVSAGVSA